MRFRIPFRELRLMCAYAERRLYDQEYRADLRAGAENLDYDPPELPDFNRPVTQAATTRRRMSDKEARGLAAMRRLQGQPFPNMAEGSF